jgi:uncharacterized DUF497 family protein
MESIDFEWDDRKDAQNYAKHGVGFLAAQQAFLDDRRVISQDIGHSGTEMRYYCFGRVGAGILTVRFTLRGRRIRVIGAGYWRKGKAIYEKANKIHE